MRKLLLGACVAAACWASDVGAMNGYCDDYFSDESNPIDEIYEGQKVDISSHGDKSLLSQYREFPDVEMLTADLKSAFQIIYRTPTATYDTGKRTEIRWNKFPKVKELVLQSDDEEFSKISNAIYDILQIDFPLYVEVTEIPRLDMLEELNMSNLNIIAIPASIQNLRNLRILNLSGNFLEELPLSIGNLRKLEILDLGANGDNENGNSLPTLPDSIGNLENLKTLDLTACSLEELPATIGNLKRLKTLILEFNPLSKLPESIGNLTNLENFFVDDYIVLPPTVRNLKKLEPGRLEELEEQIED